MHSFCHVLRSFLIMLKHVYTTWNGDNKMTLIKLLRLQLLHGVSPTKSNLLPAPLHNHITLTPSSLVGRSA